jgi:hypothetical protein
MNLKKLNGLLAKSGYTPGVDASLVGHSLEVAQRSLKIATELSLPPALCAAAYLGGLFHDLGKASKANQGAFNKSNDSSLTKDTVMHNEVSFALLKIFGDLRDLWEKLDEATNRETLHGTSCAAVYWHHAQPSEWDPVQEGMKASRELVPHILSCSGDSSSKDLGTFEDLIRLLLLKSLEQPLVKEYIPLTVRRRWEDIAKRKWGAPNPCAEDCAPGLIHKEATFGNPVVLRRNALTLSLRAILVRADRLVSSGDHSLGDEPVLNACEVKKPERYDSVRWETQNREVQKIVGYWGSTNGALTVVNAPAGFGKTLLGLLTALKHGRKVLWVCPRNEVAISVYHSLKKEMHNLGVKNSIELFYGGVRKELEHSTSEPFDSDIVVTNFDNLLKGSCDNGGPVLHLIAALQRTIVFDEYHEIPNCGGLYYAFLALCHARTCFVGKSRTLFLSATGHSVPLWLLKTGREQSSTAQYLPDVYKHLPAAHTKKYRVHIIDDPNQIKLTTGGVAVFNAVANAQKLLTSGGADLVAHSYFDDEDRATIMDYLDATFGKESSDLDLPRVSSAPILQAAKDISFLVMYESISSAENTMQRIGRLNRHGKGDSADLYILLPFSKDTGWEYKSENTARGLQVDSRLGKEWEKFIRACCAEYPGGVMECTLDELYVKYNEFSKNMHAHARSSVSSAYTDRVVLSSADASLIKPLRVLGKVADGKDRVVQKEAKSVPGSLRTPDGSYFVAPMDSEGKYTSGVVLSLSERDLVQLIECKDVWTYGKIKNLCKQLEAQGAYPELANRLRSMAKKVRNDDSVVTLKQWKNLALFESTPYPTKSWRYVKEADESLRAQGKVGLGLVKKSE